MNTKYRNTAAILLLAASLLFSPAAWALGLGDVTVKSFLNQPLEIEIDLISRETDDLETVYVRLASAADYALIGASKDAMTVPVGFTIEGEAGDARIIGTSEDAIGDPVVRLIVEVTWASGRLLREYTIFLDPPTFSEPARIPRIDKRVSPPAEPAQTDDDTAAASPAPSQQEAPAQPERDTPSARPSDPGSAPRQPVDGEYGPVSSGETLWAIASDWSRGSGMELNKVMIAIQRENPEAFLRGNINLLKRGAILRMPALDDVESISTAAAINEVSAQEEAFRGRRSGQPVASPSTPLLADEAAVPESSSAPEEPEAPAPEPGLMEDSAAEAAEAVVQDQLELVPPSEDSDLDSAYGFEESEEGAADASVTASTLREDLARKEEELITQQQENEYLADRIQELESQLAATEEDDVRDVDLANMEEKLRQERLARDAEASKKAAKPWYSGFTAWLIGLLVLAAALIGWFMSRRGGGDEVISELGSGQEQLREIKDEAEEVLRVLDEPAEGDGGDDDDGESEAAPEDQVQEEESAKPFGSSGDDAELLDEESSDPEIQLDLARAYISMGDKEAARVILEEVGNNGNEEQREEAKKMLDLLAP